MYINKIYVIQGEQFVCFPTAMRHYSVTEAPLQLIL